MGFRESVHSERVVRRCNTPKTAHTKNLFFVFGAAIRQHVSTLYRRQIALFNYLDLVPYRSRTACSRTSSRQRSTPDTSSIRAHCKQKTRKRPYDALSVGEGRAVAPNCILVLSYSAGRWGARNNDRRQTVAVDIARRS